MSKSLPTAQAEELAQTSPIHLPTAPEITSAHYPDPSPTTHADAKHHMPYSPSNTPKPYSQGQDEYQHIHLSTDEAVQEAGEVEKGWKNETHQVGGKTPHMPGQPNEAGPLPNYEG
ncbi:hypothetical protein HDV00_000223 [Rhizophlyctis rosea]|nr:hypothetical protein HDV00_000223 [Rhizophlyctis rosea]